MDKAELRRAVIARRDALDLDVRAAKSTVVCARLVELLDRLGAAAPHTVAIYAAMGSEVDPAAFAAAAAARGWRVAYPCMLSATDAMACGQRMCMRAVAADDASAAPFIAHPTRAFAATDIDSSRFPIVPAEALDMVVVPLVAFDRAGAHAWATAAAAMTAICPCSRPHAKSSASPLTSSVSTAFPPTPTTCRYPTSSAPNGWRISRRPSAPRRRGPGRRVWSGRRSS